MLSTCNLITQLPINLFLLKAESSSLTLPIRTGTAWSKKLTVAISTALLICRGLAFDAARMKWLRADASLKAVAKAAAGGVGCLGMACVAAAHIALGRAELPHHDSHPPYEVGKAPSSSAAACISWQFCGRRRNKVVACIVAQPRS